MIYDENSQPQSSDKIYEKYMSNDSKENLSPYNEEKGIYLSQNPITKEYFYTLHHCDMSMKINHLIPFYFSLLKLHPPLII